MTQGEQPRKRLQRCVHAHHREGGACHRQTEYGPQRTDTHRHTERGHQTKNKDTEADGTEHLEEGQTSDLPQTSLMGEIQDAIDIVLVEENEYQEY